MQTYGAVLLSSAGVGFIMERPLTAAARGVPKRSGGAVNMITTRLLFLFILPSLSLCAPQAQKTLSDDILAPDLPNPFGSSEENRRLLQSYIKGSLKEGQTSPEMNTREQEVFFLFSLYDYDRSGQMDGLELMQLLTDFLTYHEIMPKSTDSVVSLVDYMLQAQDLNQDGLLVPSELLSSTTDHQQENNIVSPDPPADEALKQERTHMASEDGDSETHKQDAETNQESEHENEMPADHNQITEKFEEQLQDDHQEQNMPVHQEQPEM